jgi:hypothetical protein
MFERLIEWSKSPLRANRRILRQSKIPSRPRLELLEDRLAPAVFVVNTTQDLSLSPGVNADGTIKGTTMVTLRSAIEAANATPGGNTIDLSVAGTYSITLAGTPGEVDNLAGEFAISSAGGNMTILNTSGGSVAVNGNHLARVFDINPFFSVGSSVVTNGGSGFTSPPTVVFTGGGGTGASATAIVQNGQVVGINMISDGSGYTSAPTISFTGGGGHGPAATAVLSSPKITVTMTGFTIENGVAEAGDDPAGSGGGIRDQGNPNLILNNMVITNNSASADGGGISMENVLDTPWLLQLNNTTVSFNHAGDQGGGVEEDGTGLTQINGGLITNNTSAFEGGGVYLDNIAEGGVFSVNVTNGGSGFKSPPTVVFTGGGGTGATGTAIISHGKVIGVDITNPGTGYIAPPTVSFVGGGGHGAKATANLTLGTSKLQITGATITNNVSTNSIGGGVANSGNALVDIVDSTIANNFAGTTGGGFSDENAQGTLVVSNSLFLNNVAAGNGGAIFVASPNTTITDTQIQGNSSGGNGGAIFDGGTKLTVQDSTIADNVASGNGGGIELETTGKSPGNGSSITNSTITGNVALNRDGLSTGGGINVAAGFGGTLELLNDTINGNAAATGGGISSGAAASLVSVENTIIAANFSNDFGLGADAFGAFTDAGGNVIGIAGKGSGNTGFTANTTQKGSVLSPLDPLLGPLQNNGGPTIGANGTSIVLETEALLTGSPAIDNGTADAPTTDERGFTRPDTQQGKLPDVGAFEFGGAPPV